MKLRKLSRKDALPVFVLALIPIAVALWVWLSALSFVPVPWPDDSAFYFVAKEFFKWPPRWVMLPQAPFEPSYREFNFNTMPLYPILIGLGRWIGIDGSHALKFWPLSGWALTGSLLGVYLYRAGLPFLLTLILSLAFSLDPELRWASVLVRPESLIGLAGTFMVLGLTFGFPKSLRPRGLWDPVAALLAIGAYAHFNSIHLLFPVILVFAFHPERLMRIAFRTALYLSPWLITVFTHWRLFVRQMTLQWARLDVPNGWLSTPEKALDALFHSMGSPEPWPLIIRSAAVGLWLLVGVAFLFGLVVPFLHAVEESFGIRKSAHTLLRWSLHTLRVLHLRPVGSTPLLPASGWVLGTIWLWHTKPENWFMYYLHLSIWFFVGVLALKLWKSTQAKDRAFLIALGAGVIPMVGIFAYVDVAQAMRLSKTQSWNWNTYIDFVDCVDQRLTAFQKKLQIQDPLKIWCPTFPDITVELSRRHPDWELTRTNDFWNRANLAIDHGWRTDAVVVTETVGLEERTVSKPYSEVPEIHSLWMEWPAYFLNRLWIVPEWKPNRYVCQRGRWKAFLFMEPEGQAPRKRP